MPDNREPTVEQLFFDPTAGQVLLDGLEATADFLDPHFDASAAPSKPDTLYSTGDIMVIPADKIVSTAAAEVVARLREEAEAATRHYGGLPVILGAVARGGSLPDDDSQPLSVGDTVLLGPVGALSDRKDLSPDTELEITPSALATFIESYEPASGDAKVGRATVGEIIQRQVPEIASYRNREETTGDHPHTDYRGLFDAFVSNDELFTDLESASSDETVLALFDIAFAIAPLLSTVKRTDQTGLDRNYLIGGFSNERSLIAARIIEKRFAEQLKDDPEKIVDGVLELLDTESSPEAHGLNVETVRALEQLTMPFAAEALSKRNDRIRQEMNSADDQLTITTTSIETPLKSSWGIAKPARVSSALVNATDEHVGEGISPYENHVRKINDTMKEILGTNRRLADAFGAVSRDYIAQTGIAPFYRSNHVDYFSQYAQYARFSSVLQERSALQLARDLSGIPAQSTLTEVPIMPKEFSAVPVAMPDGPNGYVRYRTRKPDGILDRVQKYSWQVAEGQLGSVFRPEIDDTKADKAGRQLAVVDRVWADVLSDVSAPEIIANLAELDYRLASNNLSSNDALLTPRARHLEFISHYIADDKLVDTYLEGVAAGMGLAELFPDDFDVESVDDEQLSVLVASGFIYSLWHEELESLTQQKNNVSEQSETPPKEDRYMPKIRGLVSVLSEEQKAEILAQDSFLILRRELRQFLSSPAK